MGVQEIILWNSDLWCVKEEYFLEVLKRHRENNSKISGTKLVYPPVEVSLNKEIDTENIRTSFPNLLGGKWRETVQFGGDSWIINHAGPVKVSPFHFRRFAKKENPLVNCDRGSNFVTGAFQILDLGYFIEIGGLNPSLSKNFQDVDLCLRANEDEEKVFYFGKDIFFYHDESLTMHNLKNEKKNDRQMISDYNLFAKLWNDKLPTMVF
jgi:GT2 family glycosyltransferase